jgi:hypothetical protein
MQCDLYRRHTSTERMQPRILGSAQSLRTCRTDRYSLPELSLFANTRPHSIHAEKTSKRILRAKPESFVFEEKTASRRITPLHAMIAVTPKRRIRIALHVSVRGLWMQTSHTIQAAFEVLASGVLRRRNTERSSDTVVAATL